MQGVTRLTRVDGQVVDYYGDGGRLITLDDERVFDYPCYTRWKSGNGNSATRRPRCSGNISTGAVS